MQKIPLSLAKPGMLLAEPVCKTSGLTIVGQGCELTEPLLAKLRDMGVDSLVIEKTELMAPGDIHQGHSVWSDRAARLDHLFRKHVDDAWMEHVKEGLRRYFLLRAVADKPCVDADASKAVSEDA